MIFMGLALVHFQKYWLLRYKTEIKIIYFVPLCLIVWFTLTLNQVCIFTISGHFLSIQAMLYRYVEVTLAKKGGPARQLLYSICSLPYTYIPEVGTPLIYHGFALEASHM